MRITIEIINDITWIIFDFFTQNEFKNEQRKHYLLAEIIFGQLFPQIQGVQNTVEQNYIDSKVISKKSNLISWTPSMLPLIEASLLWVHLKFKSS